MSKTFRRYEPDQMLLMPVALQEWLPADHLAYFISDVVDQVDLKEILSRYEGEERGYPPYHPVMMVKVLSMKTLRSTPTVLGHPPPGASRSVSMKTLPSVCWRPTTRPTSAPSPTSARNTW